VKPKNVKRTSREYVRCYESRERCRWVAQLACSVLNCGAGPCDNAHAPGDSGAGYKASARYVLPLCRAHHRESHQIGVATFEAKYGIRLADDAARTQSLWEAYTLDGWDDVLGAANV
jgi:hypothetical protein